MFIIFEGKSENFDIYHQETPAKLSTSV